MNRYPPYLIFRMYLLKRNPEIKLYGLPWVFPGWLGKGTFSPYYNRTNLVRYITKWVHGAARVHNLTIDYIGVSIYDHTISSKTLLKRMDVKSPIFILISCNFNLSNL